MALPAKFQARYARINATADGDNTIIAAPSDPAKSIYVLAYAITVSTTAGLVTFQDSAGSPAVFAVFDLAIRGGASFAGHLEAPAFKVTTGLGFEVNNGAGVDTIGHITYIIA